MPRKIRRRSDLVKPVGRPVASLRRPTTCQMGYDSAWERLANCRRNEDYGLCQACLERRRLEVSSDVDHIIPIHVRPDWRLELDNTQVLCRTHHRKKTHEDSLRYGSSTATSLTVEQRKAREEANLLAKPPRSPGGEGLFSDRSKGRAWRTLRAFRREIGEGGGRG